jgi:hypothetical protein
MFKKTSKSLERVIDLRGASHYTRNLVTPREISKIPTYTLLCPSLCPGYGGRKETKPTLSESSTCTEPLPGNFQK